MAVDAVHMIMRTFQALLDDNPTELRITQRRGQVYNNPATYRVGLVCDEKPIQPFLFGSTVLAEMTNVCN